MTEADLAIMYVLGTRPNFVKMAPVIAGLRRRLPAARHVLVHTGQHYDRMMSAVFLEELGLPEPDYTLGSGSGTHAAQTARVMERLEPVVTAERPDFVIVPGDVNSTLAATLVAVKLGFPVAHVESGLRSFDRSMPEEINRIVADEFSELLFVHSEEAVENLRVEGISGERVHFVGNTMIDTLLAMKPRFKRAEVARTLGLEPGNYLLVTLHRPALVDGPLLGEAIDVLETVSRELPVVFPLHPRTASRLGRRIRLSALQLIDPIGYIDFLSLSADARAVLTDSGGVQEETTFLGVPCFTLRDTTERPVTIRCGTNTLLGLDPARIEEIPSLLRAHRSLPDGPPPLWDGEAAARVAEVLVRSLVGQQVVS